MQGLGTTEEEVKLPGVVNWFETAAWCVTRAKSSSFPNHSCWTGVV